MTTQKVREYVLGTGEDELYRLGLQHRLWAGEAFEIWREAGFPPGGSILDVGCGPGFATFDLASVVGPGGRVVGVDESERFVNWLRAEAPRRGLPGVEAHGGDVQRLGDVRGVAPGSFDGAWARWVLCFTPDPEAVVAGVAGALRKGASFAVQDYFNYRSLSLAPRSKRMEKVLEAIVASWRGHKGDDDIGGRLPGMMRRAGLRVKVLRSIQRSVRPTDLLWSWPTSYFRTFLPKLVETGYLQETDRAAFMEEWEQRSRDPDSYFVTPHMVAVVGEKA